jgi:hypothetical protein
MNEQNACTFTARIVLDVEMEADALTTASRLTDRLAESLRWIGGPYKVTVQRGVCGFKDAFEVERR